MTALFDPDADLTALWQRLTTDPQLLALLTLSNADPLLVSERVIKRRQWDDLANGERRLCVFFDPSRKTGNQIVQEQIIRVDCHVPAKLDYVAYQVMTRVKQLLHEQPLNNRQLYLDGLLGELPSVRGYFCAGARYCFYATI